MGANTTEGTGTGAVINMKPLIYNGIVKQINLSNEVKDEINGSPIVITNNHYTLQLSDAGKCIYNTNDSGGHNVTIPLHSTVPFEIGTEIKFVAGPVDTYFVKENTETIKVYSVSATAVTDPQDSNYWSLRQRTRGSLLKVDTNVWYLDGNSIFID